MRSAAVAPRPVASCWGTLVMPLTGNW